MRRCQTEAVAQYLCGMRHWLIATGVLVMIAGVLPVVWQEAGHRDLWLVLAMAAFPAFVVARINATVQRKNADDAFLYQLGPLMFRMLFSLMGLAAFLYLREQTWNEKLVAVCWFFLGYGLYAAVELRSFVTNLRRL